jgi:hypothetical protein
MVSNKQIAMELGHRTPHAQVWEAILRVNHRMIQLSLAVKRQDAQTKEEVYAAMR